MRISLVLAIASFVNLLGACVEIEPGAVVPDRMYVVDAGDGNDDNLDKFPEVHGESNQAAEISSCLDPDDDPQWCDEDDDGVRDIDDSCPFFSNEFGEVGCDRVEVLVQLSDLFMSSNAGSVLVVHKIQGTLSVPGLMPADSFEFLLTSETLDVWWIEETTLFAIGISPVVLETGQVLAPPDVESVRFWFGDHELQTYVCNWGADDETFWLGAPSGLRIADLIGEAHSCSLLASRVE